MAGGTRAAMMDGASPRQAAAELVAFSIQPHVSGLWPRTLHSTPKEQQLILLYKSNCRVWNTVAYFLLSRFASSVCAFPLLLVTANLFHSF